MEEDYYVFDESILNDMYAYINQRVDYYIKNPFKYCPENRFMIGDLITTSYFKYNSDIVKEYFSNWIFNRKNVFICEDETSQLIIETFRIFKKIIDKVSDDTIMSWGLKATKVRSTLNKIDYEDSLEIVYNKLSDENSKIEDYLLNEELDTLDIDSIWEYMMPYLFFNNNKPITDKDDDIIIMESIYFQTGIDLVEKFTKDYYSWAAFYNNSYEEYYNNCDELSIKYLKDNKYQIVHKCFKYYLLCMDDKLGVFKSYHNLLNSNFYGKYIRRATIDNINVGPLYSGYQGYCQAMGLKPNFTFNFDLLKESIKCSVHFKNKTTEYYSSCKPQEALELTTLKFSTLFEELKSSGFIDDKTDLNDFLFIFGLKESYKEDFYPIIWKSPFSKKPGKELLIWALKLLGYTEDEIKEGKPKLSIINTCFKLEFKHKDFPKTVKVKNPHEIGDDKNLILNIISRLELGDNLWRKKFDGIQFELWSK